MQTTIDIPDTTIEKEEIDFSPLGPVTLGRKELRRMFFQRDRTGSKRVYRKHQARARNKAARAARRANRGV